jgi:ubiquinone biosynthesis protein COQ4
MFSRIEAVSSTSRSTAAPGKQPSSQAGTVRGRIMARYPVRPLEAMRAMGALINDPDDTAQVFRIVRALAGRGFERLFARVMADPTGARILEERRELMPVLDDRERLRSLPEGTLGHEYARFMDAEHISAGGLEEASLVIKTEWYDERARCLSERLRDMHDLWHVVSGYGRDLVGEGALLAFSYAQTRNRGIGFIVLMGMLKFWQAGHPEVANVFREGFRRGRRAALLPAVDWEAMLLRPLDEVRRELRIDRPPAYDAIYSDEAAATRTDAAAALSS